MSSTDPISDDDKLEQFAEQLLAGLQAHTAGWVSSVISARVLDTRVTELVENLTGDIDRVLVEVAQLLRADIDAQGANPLAIIRSLVPSLTQVLQNEGVAEVVRDPDAMRLFPGDVFDLTPGAFSDVHPELHMPGLAWGAAKAHVHLQRRRAEGQR